MTTATFDQIKAATKEFTNSVGLRRNGRSTRFLQPGIWDKTGKLMLRTRRTGRHILSAPYDDREAIEALCDGWELCDY